MKLDDNLYKAFLEELDDLENFRMAYAADHPGLPLERDDPDVKRITEAVAFFAARTRLSAFNHVFALQRRIFSQFYPFLIAPLPATGILQALPTGRFVEPLVLPEGTQVAVTPQSGGTAFFGTLQDLRILPVALDKARMLLLPSRGFRLQLSFRASYPRNDDIDWLNLHINHLNDFTASLRVFHQLRGCIKRVMAVFGDDVSETSQGPRCEFYFGAAQPDAAEATEQTPHPILREREFFHFPQRELYLNVRVPKPPRNWQRFSLCLDLRPQWPRNLVLNRDIFQLYAVPVANCSRAMAEPIVCDGTREQNPIRHSKPALGFQLHSVLGVYEVAKKGLEPLQPGILTGGNGSYEIEQVPNADPVRRHLLNLHYPGAFEAARTISVDALWVQPWFSDCMGQQQRIALYTRSATGLKWDWLGPIEPHADNPVLENMEGILRLLTLASKSSLNYSDICDLLASMGIGRRPPFSRALQNLAGLRVENAPRRTGGGSGQLRHLYILRVKSLDAAIAPLMDIFAEHVGRVLDAWIPDAAVEIRLEAPNEDWGENGKVQ